MKNSMKALSVALLLISVVPAQGMFRGLTAKLGNAMRSNNRFFSKPVVWGAMGAFGLADYTNHKPVLAEGNKLTFMLSENVDHPLVQQKRIELFEEADREIASFKFPVRIRVKVTEKTRTLSGKNDRLDSFEKKCKDNQCITTHTIATNKQSTNTITIDTLAHNWASVHRPFVVLHKHAAEYKKCLNTRKNLKMGDQYPISCQALTDTVQFRPAGEEVTNLETSIEQEVKPQQINPYIETKKSTLFQDDTKFTEV